MKNMESILIRLKTHFDPYVKTELSDWQAIGDELVVEQIKNRTVIKHPGEKEKFLRFILDGAAALLVKPGSREECLDLCFENKFLADFKSLHTNQATELYIRTFEPVSVAAIDRSGLSRICKVSPLGAILRRIITGQQDDRWLTANIERRRDATDDQ